MPSLVTFSHDRNIARVRLNRPDRHNALTPGLLDDLRNCLQLARGVDPDALVLSAEGRSFSTGGDVGGFMDHAKNPDELLAYSDRIVGTLHDAIIDLLEFPSPVFAAVNGPVTGGSLGLVLAADLIAMSETAFLQPYYGVVGFGPDGGWTALLPERIGTAKALELQYLNSRLKAEDALRLGLANAVVPEKDVAHQIDTWTASIANMNSNTLKTTRANIWDKPRISTVRERLNQEKHRFLQRVTARDTLEGMKRFTGRP
ncbi:enoyl-CoA hydratase/isomerase family protein [uncultured Roseibium sp.]|uniref:enoyl-CoA hydratase/isomerase family protein n=1 Tax=uncultured Roseibium sp. TaxID=1936171 RepID=UPI0032174131